MRIVGIVIRHRHHRDRFRRCARRARRPAAAMVWNLVAGGEKLVAQRVLHAQIDRKLDRILQAVGGEPRHVQSRKPVAVEPLLHAGDALVVDIDMTQDVRSFIAARIVALVLRQEADARQALAIDRALLLRRDVALEPDKAALRREPLAQFVGIEIGQIGGEQLDCFVHVDQPARLGIKRGHAHVGRQHFAVAVENVRARSGDGVAAADPMGAAALGDDAEGNQPRGDDQINDREGEDREPDPRPRFHVAVDLAAVEDRAQSAAAPWFGRSRRRRFCWRRDDRSCNDRQLRSLSHERICRRLDRRDLYPRARADVRPPPTAGSRPLPGSACPPPQQAAAYRPLSSWSSVKPPGFCCALGCIGVARGVCGCRRRRARGHGRGHRLLRD